MPIRSGLRSSGSASLGIARQQGQDLLQQLRDIAHKHQHACQPMLEQLGGVRAVAHPARCVQLGLNAGACAQQRRQRIGQHLGGHIHAQGVLAQARDGFELHRMLQALVRLLDTPALVVQLGKSLAAESIAGQIGHHHLEAAIGAHHPHQAHRGALARQLVVQHVEPFGRPERDMGLILVAAQQLPGGTPAAGIVTADAVAHPSLIEQGHQSVAGIAPVEHQHIIRPPEFDTNRAKPLIPLNPVFKLPLRSATQGSSVPLPAVVSSSPALP